MARSKREQLTRDGFCVVEGVLTAAFVQELRDETDRLLDSVDHPPSWKYQGSDLHINGRENPVIDRLVRWQPALDALREMELGDFGSRGGFIILSKPPGGPPLYWHQDWTQWNDPISAAPWPQYLFLSYYLVDTNEENGCFRVMPGTHVKRVPLHDRLLVPHANETYFAPEEDSDLFGDPPGAIDVPVKAGDLVIGEGRLLHAARANRSSLRRTLLLSWLDRPATVPAYWAGEVPDAIIERPAGAQFPSTRVPGEYLASP